MKNLKSLLLFCFFPLFGIAQSSINGVYIGTLSNDSTTIRRDQSFEMALTEYKDKVYGYAYSTFIINDTLYYIVKRVKGTITGNTCEVEDDEVISHNFPKKPEKKVFVSYTLHRSSADSSWSLDGNWKTNLTKKYYAISGKVEAKEEKDLSKSKLYEHLGDLNLQNTLAFNKPKESTPEKKTTKAKETKTDVAKNDIKKSDKKDIAPDEIKGLDKKPESVVKTETKVPDTKTTSTAINNNQPNQNEKKDVAATNINPIVKTETKLPENKTANTAINNQPDLNEKKTSVSANAKPVEKKPEISVAKQETKLPDNKPVVVTANNQPNQNEKKNVTAVNTTTNTVKTETKVPEKKLVSVPVGNQPVQTEKKDVAIVDQKSNEKKADAGFEFQELKSPIRRLKPASTLVDSRESIPSETIFFKSDSLSLALYDNGEVDGDTVSVVINDVMFIEKQGLKSSAFRKTFYVPADESDSLLVVLFAENLGKYPPNTGLLQIKDGEEIYYVRFKADFDRNAAIVLKRKYK